LQEKADLFLFPIQAYLRVSTGTQDLANQKLAILEYARRKKFSINEFIEVQISSRKKPHQRGIDGMLERLAPGDRLIVSELSRLGRSLGRSLGQVIHIVDELVKRKIRFTAIKESIHFEGKQEKTFVVMTEEMTKTEAPAMLVLRRNNYLFGYDKVLANYRVQRKTYIVDTVFDRAILVSGRDKVTIARVPGKVHEINTNAATGK
jgi:Resolvase, N terminal domain